MTGPAFFTLHDDLPREGPGDAQSVAFAARLAGVKADARILDAGAGPGADIPALLAAAPRGHVTAIEAHAPFAERAAAAHAGDPRVTVRVGDMADPGGPYDFIWCAGALYFLGIEEGLRGWRDALVAGGAVAFTDAVWLTDTPPEQARAFWAEYAAMTDEAGVRAACARAGYSVLGTRLLPETAWDAYYRPMEARIAMLREGPLDAALANVLAEGEAEIALRRNHGACYGYMLFVVRPE